MTSVSSRKPMPMRPRTTITPMMTGMSWNSIASNRTDDRPCISSSYSTMIMPASTVGKVRNEPARTGAMTLRATCLSRTARSVSPLARAGEDVVLGPLGVHARRASRSITWPNEMSRMPTSARAGVPRPVLAVMSPGRAGRARGARARPARSRRRRRAATRGWRAPRRARAAARRPYARTTSATARAAHSPRAMSQRTSPGVSAPGSPVDRPAPQLEAITGEAHRLAGVEQRVTQPADEDEDEEGREDRRRKNAGRRDGDPAPASPVPGSDPAEQLADDEADHAAGDEDRQRDRQRLSDEIDHRRRRRRSCRGRRAPGRG